MKWRIVQVNGLGFKVQSRDTFCFVPMWGNWGKPYYPGKVMIKYFSTIEEARKYLGECRELLLQRDSPNDFIVETYEK